MTPIITPASYIQQQFWLNQKLHPDDSTYNISYIWSIKGNLNINYLKSAIKDVVNTFEIFRTKYAFNNNILNQEIYENIDFDTEYVDLNNSNEIFVLNSCNNKYLQEQINRPFNLNTDWPIRAIIVKLSDEEYYLSITIQHISTDLFTWNILTGSLSKYYANYITENHNSIVVQKYNYKDYSIRYKEWSDSEEHKKKLEFWKNYFTDVSSIVEYPIDKKRPNVFTHEGAREFFTLSKEATLKLNELSENEYIIVFSYLLSAYALLIFKYSQQKKFSIGVPFTNRKNANDVSVAGCFVNILPVIVDFEANPTFKSLCSAIQKTMIGINRNQEISYLEILNNLNVKFDPQYNPLFHFGFTYEPVINLSLQNLEVFPHSEIEKEGSQLDKFIHIREYNGCIQGYVEYCSSLFNNDSVKRFADNYTWVLSNLDKIIDEPVSKTDIINILEKETILKEWNSTTTFYESKKCIHTVFEEQVLKTPNSIALVSDTGILTYTEFNAKANQLAHYLLKLGVKTEERIGIYIERSPEMMIAIYAVLKAGGTYVPLDINYPTDRIEYIISDSEINILLTKTHLTNCFNSPNLIKIELDSQWVNISKENIYNPSTNVNSKNLAYLIYTSGSTGIPKGVMIEHHAVINRLFWMQKSYPLKTNDTILQKTPISFDVSVWELFWWGFFGAKLGILKAGGERFPEAIIAAVQKFEVTVMHFVPSMLNAFLTYINDKTFTEKLKPLKTIFASGEALTPATVNTFNTLLLTDNNTNLINLYGPTEATVDVSYFNCNSTDPLEIIPIGKPIDNTKLYIVDENMNLTPIGVKGELLIGGIQLARGYLNKAELTAEKFIDNPFDNEFNKKLYRTGDLARFLPDGNIEYLGRIDFQVKIHGFRIELGEIEVSMCKHPLVSDSVVVVNDSIGGDKTLIGYVVSSNISKNNEIIEDLYKSLRMNLPEYMIPLTIIALEKFPVTSNGKLDRKALPPPEKLRTRTLEKVKSKSATETILLDIWKSILRIDEIGTTDNFFNVGGNSILVIQVASQIQKKLNINIEVIKLFEYPTISTLACFLNKDDKLETKQIGDDRGTRMRNNISRRMNHD